MHNVSKFNLLFYKHLYMNNQDYVMLFETYQYLK